MDLSDVGCNGIKLSDNPNLPLDRYRLQLLLRDAQLFPELRNIVPPLSPHLSRALHPVDNTRMGPIQVN